MAGIVVATVGDNCIDRYGAPINLSTVGGNALNVAVQLARLGRHSEYFGAVGQDEAGARTLAELRTNGVGIAHVQERCGSTAYTELRIDPDGDRSIGFEDFGVCRGYRPSDLDTFVLRQARHVHLGWLDDGGELKRALSDAGVSVSQDLSINADPSSLGGHALTIAFVSGGSSIARAEALAADALAAGARVAVVTCGASGSLACDGAAQAETGICPVDVLDTTGAGDAFAAGFIDAYLANATLLACLERARDVAAQACTHFGGFSQTPRALAGGPHTVC